MMTEISNYNKKIETLFEQAKAGDKTALDELLTEYTFFYDALDNKCFDYCLYENIYWYLKKFLNDNFEYILCNYEKDMDVNFILLMLKTNIYYDLFDFESWYKELYKKVNNEFDYNGALDVSDVIRYKSEWENYKVRENYPKLLAYYGDENYANEEYKIGPRNDLKLAIMYVNVDGYTYEDQLHLLFKKIDCYALGIGVKKDIEKARKLCFDLFYDFKEYFYQKYDDWYDYDYRNCSDDLFNATKIKLLSICFLDYNELIKGKLEWSYREYLGSEFFEHSKYSDQIVDIMVKLMKYENGGLNTAIAAKCTLKKLREYNLTRDNEKLVESVIAYYNYGKNGKYDLKGCLNFFGVKFEDLIKNEKFRNERANYYQELNWADCNNVYEIEKTLIKVGREKERQERLSSLKQSLKDTQRSIEFYNQQIANAYQRIEELKKEIINLENDIKD